MKPAARHERTAPIGRRARSRVGIYFRTNRLPVLFLLYVAITALTRFLAIDIKDLSVARVLVVTGSIFVLTLAVLAVQIAASRFAAGVRRRHREGRGFGR